MTSVPLLRAPWPRRGLLTVLTIGVVATCAARAQAQGSVGITNLSTGLTNESTTPLSELPAPDVTNQTYNNIITTEGGAPETVTVPSGYSLALLFSSLDPGVSFTFAEVYLPDGRSLLLTHAQATSKTAFPDGPAVVWDNSQGLHFLTPSTGPGTSDAGEATVAPADNQSLLIYLHTGSILTVNITASTQKLAVDTQVSFTATVSGASPGIAVSYRWSFGDGTGSSTEAPVSHSYLVPGTYDVYLRATGSDDSLGFSSLIPITVGKAPKGPDRNGGGASTKKNAPTSGAGVKGAGHKKSTSTKKWTVAEASTGATTATETGSTRSPTLAESSGRARAVRLPRPSHGPMLSGIAVSGLSLAAARPIAPASTRPGATNAARTGHLTPARRTPGEELWIPLGVLATLLGGALFELMGAPVIRPRPRAT